MKTPFSNGGVRAGSGTRGRPQVWSACDLGAISGISVGLSALLIFFFTFVRALFMTESWNAALALFVDGLIWSALVGSVGALLIVVSNAMRCLYDLTYTKVSPLDGGG
jgi:hypothetical protein